jgi:T5SS/PEP-CTERM-associated repeat protein
LPIFKDLLYLARARSHPNPTRSAANPLPLVEPGFYSALDPVFPLTRVSAMRRNFLSLAVAFLSICVTSSAFAATREWISIQGTNAFGVASNWNPAVVPSSNDTALFDLTGTYTVTVAGGANVGTLNQTKGDITMTATNAFVSASSFTLNGTEASGVATNLHINGGNITPGSLAIGNNLGTKSNLYLDTASATNVPFNTFYVGNAGTGNLWLQNGSTLATSNGAGIGISTSGVGTATVAGATALGVNAAWTITNQPLLVGSFGNGTLNILANGSVTTTDLEVGKELGSVGTISMSGNSATFTAAATGVANIGGNLATAPAASATLNIGTGATMNLNGTTNLRTNAKINVTGGQLNLKTVNVATGAIVNWTSGTINFATAPTITPSMLDLLLAGTHTLGVNRTLSATAGTLTLTTPLTLAGGAISVPILDINTNMELSAFSSITASDTVTLETGKTFQLNDFSTLGATNFVINNGGTFLLNGTLANVTGPMANNAGYVRGTGRFTAGLNNGAAGTIRVESGDDLIIDTVGPTNLGTIELAGGTVEYSKTLSNLAGGTISGRGIFRGSASTPGGNGVSNLGVMSFSAGITDIFGDVNNGASGKIVAAGASTVTFYDDVVNNGDIRTVLGSRTVFFGSVSGAGTFTGGGTTEFEGDLKPGNSPANVTFGGNVVISPTAGTIIELAGTTKGAQYDSLTIAGTASLSGALDVVLLGGFIPSPGQSFNILTAAGGLDGTFDTTNLPALAGGLYFNLAYTPTAINLSVAGILGDYNRNGTIDASDYVVWRKTVSQSGPALAADGNNDGHIDSGDFAIWRTSYGAQAAGSGASFTATIPEPTSLVMLLIAAAALPLRARCTNRRS